MLNIFEMTFIFFITGMILLTLYLFLEGVIYGILLFIGRLFNENIKNKMTIQKYQKDILIGARFRVITFTLISLIFFSFNCLFKGDSNNWNKYFNEFYHYIESNYNYFLLSILVTYLAYLIVLFINLLNDRQEDYVLKVILILNSIFVGLLSYHLGGEILSSV